MDFNRQLLFRASMLGQYAPGLFWGHGQRTANQRANQAGKNPSAK